MYKLVCVIVFMLFTLSGCKSKEVDTESPTRLTFIAKMDEPSLNHSETPSNNESQIELQSSKGMTLVSEKPFTETDYREMLISAKNNQEQYIDSLPTNQRQDVQTSLAAMIEKYNELIMSHPEDHLKIDSVFQDLMQLD